MSLANLARYFFLLRHFRNGPALIRNLRQGGLLPGGPPCEQAILWGGQKICAPGDEGGLVGTILEVWHQRCYSPPGFYDPREGDIVLDLGANVGLFSLFAARHWRGTRVFAYEASPTTFQCLQQNIENFGLDNVQAFHRAVGGQPGTARICKSSATKRSTDTRVISSDREEKEEELVKIATLPEIMEEQAIDRVAFLKMDIEGSENDVFRHLDLDTLQRIDRLALEYHDNLVPGTLASIQEKLHPSHTMEIVPARSPDGRDLGYGSIWARRRHDGEIADRPRDSSTSEQSPSMKSSENP